MAQPLEVSSESPAGRPDSETPGLAHDHLLKHMVTNSVVRLPQRRVNQILLPWDKYAFEAFINLRDEHQIGVINLSYRYLHLAKHRVSQIHGDDESFHQPDPTKPTATTPSLQQTFIHLYDMLCVLSVLTDFSVCPRF